MDLGKIARKSNLKIGVLGRTLEPLNMELKVCRLSFAISISK
jgi:hypothetical protein